MREAGMSLLELLVTLTIMTMIMGMAGLAAVPWIATESGRSAIHDAGILLQRAKAEALSRNRNCRFLVDTQLRTMNVLDGNGTTGFSDDILLVERRLPSPVGFARPDTGAAVTFAAVSGSAYEVVFDSAGRVESGTGEMVLYGGGHYRRVTVYGAGGIRFERWDGAMWTREY